MKRTPWLFGSLAAALIVGCSGNREKNNDTGAAGAGTESGTMQGGAGTATDTTAAAPTTGGNTTGDTARTGSRMHHDSMAPGAEAGSDTSQGPRTKPDTSAGSNQ